MLNSQHIAALSGAIIGLACGFLLFNTHNEIKSLRSELNTVYSELASLRANRSNIMTASLHTRQRGRQLDSLDRSKETSSPTNPKDGPSWYERQQNGELILEHERPGIADFEQRAAVNLAARHASNNAPRLNAVFATLNINPEISQQLINNQQKIAEASVLAETSISQLLSARYKYDKQIRSLISDDDYAKYIAAEKSNAAYREYGEFADFLKQSGWTAEDGNKEKIVGIIQQAEAYTRSYFLGPYDAIPQPIVDPANGIPWLEQQKENITKAANLVSQYCEEAGLPDSYRSILSSYYQNRVQEYQMGIELSNPAKLQAYIEARNAELDASREKMKQTQQSSQGKPMP